MAVKRVKITNWDNWGKLVKSWVCKDNRLPELFVSASGKPLKKIPRPKDLAHFKALCATAMVGITLPPHFKKLKIIEQKKSDLFLKLPPPELVKASEKHLSDGGDYDLPNFYNDFLKRQSEAAPKPDDTLEVPAALTADFHTARTGDYVIQQCM